ncbi:hypothetical protein [Methylomonas rosea]|uniref:Uncharacterized protein n=1 Tax=Methylomonas rosea TaxID=2952227 RepID=A0ABT1TNS7_9GAMM|nr:hypothetical protein [Methylomonas sp. WSC-7]MCQ8116026.1 hypothetical protein [Methylomonas sp. WSC-7]
MSKFMLWDLPDVVIFQSKCQARFMPNNNRKCRKWVRARVSAALVPIGLVFAEFGGKAYG